MGTNTKNRALKVAIIDMNNNTPNESMRCLKQMVAEQQQLTGMELDLHIYDARYKDEIPGLGYDLYISSGGPGSPFEDEGKNWEKKYFRLLDRIWLHNENNDTHKKFVFFICHSFQLMCRFFNIGEITKRETMAFGVNPVEKTVYGRKDPLLKGLPDPFYVADFRNYQVIEPDLHHLAMLDAKILSLEVLEPHEQRPRALTGIRITQEMVGTQFHPEADAPGMILHFQTPEKKQLIVEKYGEAKYQEIIEHFDDPDKIALTHSTIIPRFINETIHHFQETYSLVP